MNSFSKDAYRNLLQLAKKEGYKFLGFQDLRGVGEGRYIYLRHDVDYSLSMALELAQINASIGVRGTFFFLLRSQIYNLLSHWALDRVKEIHASGQRLAFHCALPASIPENHESLARIVLDDFDIVKRQIPEIEPVYSWHNPTREVLDLSVNFDLHGFVNVYHERFIKKAQYLSDSNLRYSVPEWENFLAGKERSDLHLLFHPLNWIAGGKDMCEVLAKTWQYIIKERELEIGLNATYQKMMPRGMPDAVLHQFSSQWLKAALQGKHQPS